MPPRDRPVEVLIRFSRLVSDTATSVDILPLLADAAVEHLGASAVAVFSVIADGGLVLHATRNLPEDLRGLVAQADTIGSDLGRHLLHTCKERFVRAHTLPLVSSGDLFGAAVMLYDQPVTLEPPQRELAEGLADLAAIALNKTSQYEQLRRSYAELQASRQVLVRSEKLRALGQMASGVSHDLRNILHPLLLQVQLLRRSRADLSEEEIEDTLEGMERVLWRGVDTVDRLRKFSRQTPDARVAPMCVDDLVREAVSLCRPRLRQAGGEIIVDEQLGSPPPVPLETTECLNAVMNLLVNAIEAMPLGGLIKVRTGASHGGAWIEVRDAGPGIPPEVEAHLFEPFFTTKGEQGTGLGLSMVYAFAQRHGGWVKVDSRPGAGTAFTIWLPETQQGPVVVSG